jgi:1-acyl-sn-glycerol-3-phosphate acyltransferase
MSSSVAGGPRSAQPGGEWPKDRKTWWPWRICAAILFPLLWILAKVEVRHGERIPPTGPVVVGSNHMSIIDPVYLVKAFWRKGRLARFLAKQSIWKVPVIGHIMQRSGQIPVDRVGSAASSLRAAEHLVETGKLLLVYPEATLTRDPALWPMKGKTGAARLALESGAPLLPIAHWGAQRLMAPYGKLHWWPFPRKRIVVLVGEPLDLTAWRDRPIDQRALAEITDLLMDAITALQAELRRETPPEHRWDMAVDGDPYRRAAKS